MPRPAYPMPGRFPGRVAEVKNPAAVRSDYTLNQEVVGQMIDRGMMKLTGADAPLEAWRTFFQPGDIVGIKLNPVGRKQLPGEWGRNSNSLGVVSSPEVLLKVVARHEQQRGPQPPGRLCVRYVRLPGSLGSKPVQHLHSRDSGPGDKETRRQGDKETRRQGDKETRRPEDTKTPRQ